MYDLLNVKEEWEAFRVKNDEAKVRRTADSS